MPPPDINPYESPPGALLSNKSGALAPLRLPGTILMVLAISWGLLGVVLLLNLLAGLRPTDSRTFNWFVRSSGFDLYFYIAVSLGNFYTAYGAWCLRRGIRCWDAFTAAVLACVPFLSPWQFLGIPFGIWALVVLCRRDVRAAFDARN